jgi:hypothetical protein
MLEAARAARVLQTQQAALALQRQQQRREDKMRLAVVAQQQQLKTGAVRAWKPDSHPMDREGTRRLSGAAVRPVSSSSSGRGHHSVNAETSVAGFAGLRTHLASFVGKDARRTGPAHPSSPAVRPGGALAQLRTSLAALFHHPAAARLIHLRPAAAAALLLLLILLRRRRRSLLARSPSNPLASISFLAARLLAAFAQLARIALPRAL